MLSFKQTKLSEKEEKISEYLFFLEETIKNDYIPKYNHMIELIQKSQKSAPTIYTDTFTEKIDIFGTSIGKDGMYLV